MARETEEWATGTLGPLGARIAGAAAGAGSELFAPLGERGGALLGLTIAVMALDLATELGRVYLDPRRRWSAARLRAALVSKLMRLALVVVAALLDWAAILLVPDSADGLARWMPTTRSVFVWLSLAEAGGVIDNVRRSQGDRIVPPALVRALHRLRGVDSPAVRSRRPRRPG